jgi:hypothetical protein
LRFTGVNSAGAASGVGYDVIIDPSEPATHQHLDYLGSGPGGQPYGQCAVLRIGRWANHVTATVKIGCLPDRRLRFVRVPTDPDQFAGEALTRVWINARHDMGSAGDQILSTTSTPDISLR